MCGCASERQGGLGLSVNVVLTSTQQLEKIREGQKSKKQTTEVGSLGVRKNVPFR